MREPVEIDLANETLPVENVLRIVLIKSAFKRTMNVDVA